MKKIMLMIILISVLFLSGCLTSELYEEYRDFCVIKTTNVGSYPEAKYDNKIMCCYKYGLGETCELYNLSDE